MVEVSKTPSVRDNQLESTDVPEEKTPTIRSIKRAADILDACAEEDEPIRLRDLMARTQLPKTTVIRILETLSTEGLVWTTEDGRAMLGPRFLRWAEISGRAWRVPEDIAQVLRTLVNFSGETVALYVRSGYSRVCIFYEQGTRSVRHVVPEGTLLPLWCGAPSKILLEGADVKTIGEIAARSGGRVTPTELAKSILNSAEQGFSISHGEREPGASSVAAPVRSRDGTVVAALSLSGPTSRFSEDFIKDNVPSLINSASEISTRDFYGRVAHHYR